MDLEEMSKVIVTGGTGMVGSAFKRLSDKYLLIGSSDYDLRDADQCDQLFKDNRDAEAVIHLAARVGGVQDNIGNPTSFFSDNILMNCNVLNAAHHADVDRALSLLSTCVYPVNAEMPYTEKDVHSGEPHETHFSYAYSKRMLDVQSRGYRKQFGRKYTTAIPNNIYGSHDNFDLNKSHVIPGLIRKIYEAKKNESFVEIWGSGNPLREFTFSLDVAKSLEFLLNMENPPPVVNIGNCREYTIKEVVRVICNKLDFQGEIKWNSQKPDGQFRKPSDNSMFIELGWSNDKFTSLEDGISITCDWFREFYPNIRGYDDKVG
jgi:GDP-L-fucose synthase